jgi:hemerythrin-like domain-containing protein
MPTATTAAPLSDIQRSMREDHARLERVFEAVLAAFQADARAELSELWARFESGLRRHFELEEQLMLPRFKSSQPLEAAQLALEHVAILKKLEQLGINVDLHLTRADVVADFIATIRAHAAREDALMYVWANTNEDNGWKQVVVAAVRQLESHLHAVVSSQR